MNAILKERVRIALARVEIALGYDVNAHDLKHQPEYDRAIRIIESLREESSEEETPLELLDLPTAICGYLYSAGVMSVEQLVMMTDSQLMQIDQIRAGRLREIDHYLQRAGLRRG